MAAPFGKVEVCVPLNSGVQFYIYDGKHHYPGDKFFVCKGDENCFEQSTGFFGEGLDCWPELCKTVNGAYEIESPDQVNVPAGESIKVTVPVHPNEKCGKPGMVLFVPLCGGCYSVSPGEDVLPNAEPGEQITDGSAPISNPASLYLGSSCNGDQVECFHVTNLGTADLPINLLWGRA
jgi:hypothetical protein